MPPPRRFRGFRHRRPLGYLTVFIGYAITLYSDFFNSNMGLTPLQAEIPPVGLSGAAPRIDRLRQRRHGRGTTEQTAEPVGKVGKDAVHLPFQHPLHLRLPVDGVDEHL